MLQFFNEIYKSNFQPLARKPQYKIFPEKIIESISNFETVATLCRKLEVTSIDFDETLEFEKVHCGPVLGWFR